MKLDIYKIGVSLFIFMLLTTNVNFKNTIAKNTTSVNKISNTTKKSAVVSNKELNEHSKTLDFNLNYPEVKLDDEHVQNKINITLKQEIYGFKKSIEDIHKESIAIHPTAFKYSGSSSFKYKIIDNVLSVKVNLDQFTGGAHPMTFIRTYNFDLNTGNILKLEEIFNQEGKKIYKNKINKIITDKMYENPDNYFIDEFKGINENTQYYLDEDNIIIFFQLYEIAPYTAGIPEFKIPYSEFKENIKINNLQ